jgi:hypothetical protein
MFGTFLKSTAFTLMISLPAYAEQVTGQVLKGA